MADPPEDNGVGPERLQGGGGEDGVMRDDAAGREGRAGASFARTSDEDGGVRLFFFFRGILHRAEVVHQRVVAAGQEGHVEFVRKVAPGVAGALVEGEDGVPAAPEKGDDALRAQVAGRR